MVWLYLLHKMIFSVSNFKIGIGTAVGIGNITSSLP